MIFVWTLQPPWQSSAFGVFLQTASVFSLTANHRIQPEETELKMLLDALRNGTLCKVFVMFIYLCFMTIDWLTLFGWTGPDAARVEPSHPFEENPRRRDHCDRCKQHL